MAFKTELPYLVGILSYNSIANSVGLDVRENGRKPKDIMFIYDLRYLNTDCPELLFQVGLLVPGRFTRSLSLFNVPKYSTRIASNTHISPDPS